MKIQLHTEPFWNDKLMCYEYGTADDEFYVCVIPMLFNHRLVLWPKDDPTGYTVGWCYADASSASLAVLLWANTKSEWPVGYIKRVGEGA